VLGFLEYFLCTLRILRSGDHRQESARDALDAFSCTDDP
jgi:hypothetical protein